MNKPIESWSRHTTRVVAGPLALRMERIKAARNNELGVEVTTLPLLAARLAGGFCRPADTELLQDAIRDALGTCTFQELNAVRDLPGMVRAVHQTLTAVWRADVELHGGASARVRDLATLEDHVRTILPIGALTPRDLRDAALARLAHAERLLGSVHFAGIVDVDPIWRPLICALADHVPLSWATPCAGDRSWFPGTMIEPPAGGRIESRAVICADPHAEAVEALRWARALLVSGVPASHIAIAAATCGAWDETMLVLSRSGALPVHFTHGIAALEGSAGQACAALADLLLRGLSQTRVRRLLRRSARAREGLPDDWAKGLRRSAGLFTEEQWRTALVANRSERSSGAMVENLLLPRIADLARGATFALNAGDIFLEGPALALWKQALRAAPAEALDTSLQALRVDDGISPGAAISWGPAAHLAAAPRPYARLLGLTGRTWPRPGSEDPLLPDHILPRERLEPVPRSEQDIRLFKAIQAGANCDFVLSKSRRSAEGGLLPPSRLFPMERAEMLAKVRTPAHAFSESDRLLARPLEARQKPSLALARSAWRAWHSPHTTAWDGQIAREDPVVAASLAREQSATSLRRLLRDPLGFVWRYGLGWRSAESHAELLALDATGFGELVHDLIKRAVEAMEPSPGLNRATHYELHDAVAVAGAEVLGRWPSERPVPPGLLWRRTVDEAMRLAMAGLEFDQGLQPGTRSWSEVTFGEAATLAPPFENGADVILGGLRVGGRIDRLDLRGDGGAVRVTDYKTGTAPKNVGNVVLAGGAELQRVIYAAAVRRRMPDVRQVVSRLVYLRGTPTAHALAADLLEDAIAQAERFIAAVVASLSEGLAPIGPDARERFSDLRLALPAELDTYLLRKSAALAAATDQLSDCWSAR